MPTSIVRPLTTFQSQITCLVFESRATVQTYGTAETMGIFLAVEMRQLIQVVEHCQEVDVGTR